MSVREGRHAILEVCLGDGRGRKAIVAPGGRLTVGRAERADFAFVKDERMSALHFELAWDGRSARLRPLQALVPTLLAGAECPADGAEVTHGQWIQAGTTDLRMFIEDHTPPRLDPELNIEFEDDDDPEAVAIMKSAEEQVARRQARRARILARLRERAAAAPLYAVLDAARDDRILEICRESVEPYVSLYSGLEGEQLAEVAPHLIRLPPGSRLLEKLVMEGWGERWGIYIGTSLSMEQVRRHLKRFLMVVDEDDERLYFRFYDPAVLRDFLPTCSVRQRSEFFGELDAFIAERDEGNLVVFTSVGGTDA
ncbi:DUF4123 domain-containing protein [Sorangium sp. So ce367]|uniref:DUF4123 domain-containing protein n=1 Tax=Sorangium sp. So ce367 TaxID=3133305 RepID=UPI003F5DCF2A